MATTRKQQQTQAQAPPKSFEDALSELEQILSEIEAGEIGLEQSLTRYERGTYLIQHCRGVLTAAEKQIELLSKSPEGGLATEPIPADELSGDSAAEADDEKDDQDDEAKE